MEEETRRKGRMGKSESEEKTKVLVVEDNLVNQKVLKKMLSKFEIECDIADNGLIALEILKSNSYPIIFMDIMMPEMNGLDCALAIRENDQQTPIITVSANNDADHVKKSRECGMNDFVSKPVSIAKIKGLLEKYKIGKV